MDNVTNYALQILHDHGCDEYSYGGTCGDTILSDLKEAYPNGMEYPMWMLPMPSWRSAR